METLTSASSNTTSEKKKKPYVRLAGLLSHAFASLAVFVWRFGGDWRGLRPVLTRTIAHLSIIAVAVGVFFLSTTQWPAFAAQSLPSVDEIFAQQGTPEPEAVPERAVLSRSSQLVYVNNAAPLVRRAEPHTIIPERPRLSVITYTVQAGDTVESIAQRFGLEPTTIAWSNAAVEDAPDLLRISQVLVILPIDGIYHTVAEDDTFESIAEEYEVEVVDIVSCEYNGFDPANPLLVPGTSIIVPGGEKEYIPRTITSYGGPVPEGAAGSGLFDWPVLGYISQGYWYAHRAIDIAAPTGTAVRAADGGYVSFAGWTDIGYGYLVVIDHNNGFSTYYAHLSNFYVSAGQVVERGQVFAAVGSTGWSTGPHTHFEIRYAGVPQNPRAYLP
ncbi:MAG: peptidoglycan DD-metalloendopeptidase family protein [Anaerolineae bacterium]|nr:peptidoglycan DD-metalloendopeptidase family protein [Anaerolineae bacterium]